jgi:hypothetical protein
VRWASSPRREKKMKKVAMLAGLAMAFTTALAGVARADTTLGSTVFPAGADASSCSNSVIAQPTSDSSTPYTVPTPPVGPLSRWQVNAVGATAGAPVTLVVLRSTGPTTYTVVGADTQAMPSSPPPGNIASFTVPSPIAVSGGEILAVYSPGVAFVCYFHDGATPAADSLISLDTPATPVAGQGLSLDDSSGPGYTLNLAATLTTPVVPPKKKCKKHKKKRSAESAKKKKCKKKRRH